MINWFRNLFRKIDPTDASQPAEKQAEVDAVKASVYDQGDIGEVCWDPDHNPNQLTVTADGLTVEWDDSKDNESENLPCWVPASTQLYLHSGQFHLDFQIEEMAKGQVGVGFMLQLTDGANTGGDWGFFGYLGSSNTAWAYDPSTGDVVTATESIEGGLPKFEDGHSGIVQLHLILPRRDFGVAKFKVKGVESKPIALPTEAVVLPAACLLKTGQRIMLTNFSRLPIYEEAQQSHATDA